MPSLLKPLHKDINKKSIIQAILFPKKYYSISDAQNWLHFHNYRYIHNRDTTNMHRFRINETIKGYEYYTVTLPTHIELVYMYK